jgi:hypothetical protein
LDYLIATGQLKAVRAGLRGGKVLVSNKSIEAYISKLEKEAV